MGVGRRGVGIKSQKDIMALRLKGKDIDGEVGKELMTRVRRGMPLVSQSIVLLGPNSSRSCIGWVGLTGTISCNDAEVSIATKLKCLGCPSAKGVGVKLENVS